MFTAGRGGGDCPCGTACMFGAHELGAAKETSKCLRGELRHPQDEHSTISRFLSTTQTLPRRAPHALNNYFDPSIISKCKCTPNTVGWQPLADGLIQVQIELKSRSMVQKFRVRVAGI